MMTLKARIEAATKGLADWLGCPVTEIPDANSICGKGTSFRWVAKGGWAVAYDVTGGMKYPVGFGNVSKEIWFLGGTPLDKTLVQTVLATVRNEQGQGQGMEILPAKGPEKPAAVSVASTDTRI